MGVETTRVSPPIGYHLTFHGRHVLTPCSRVDAANIRVFLSDDSTPSSVHINVQLPTQLYTFLASRPRATTSFTISPFQSLHATASVPILATRHQVHDTLVLNHAGSLELVTSGGRSLGISIPKQPATGDGRDEVAHRLTGLRMVLEEDERMGAAERRIVGLSDAVGSRCTVIFEDGEKLRISADFRIQHLLVRQCFEALSYVLTPEAFFSFKRELVAHLQNLSSLERGDDVAPWTVFQGVLFAMVDISLPAPQGNAYERLLEASQQSADPVTRRLAARAQAKRWQASPQPTPPQALGAKIDPTEIPGILLALHLVAQDCRLSSSRQKDLTAVATVLIELSGRMGRADWRDYWLRLVPSQPGTIEIPHSESYIHYDRHIADCHSHPRRHLPCRPIPESARHPRLSLSSSSRPDQAISLASNLRASRVGARLPEPLLADRADMRSLRPTRSSLSSETRLGDRPRCRCGTLHGIDRIDGRLGGRPSSWTRSSRPGDDEGMPTFARNGLARRGV